MTDLVLPPEAEPAAAERPRVVAFFDLDKTVVGKPAMVAFARPLYRAGFIDRRLVALAAWNHFQFRFARSSPARMERFKAQAMRIVVGWEAERLQAVIRESLPAALAPAVYQGARDLIEGHRAAGRQVWLVTAEPREITEPMVEFLGVDGCISSEAEVGADGRYTGLAHRWVYGPTKAVAIAEEAERRGFDLAGSYAYSDSATDLPMLELVGHPVCVNPDRRLAAVARQRGWDVVRFT